MDFGLLLIRAVGIGFLTADYADYADYADFFSMNGGLLVTSHTLKFSNHKSIHADYFTTASIAPSTSSHSLSSTAVTLPLIPFGWVSFGASALLGTV